MKVREVKGELIASITQNAKKLQWKRGDRLASITTEDGDLVIVNLDRKKKTKWWEK